MWSTGRSGRDSRKSRDADPLIDIERLLVNYAWTELAEPTLLDRLFKSKKYKLEVNWGYLDISHRVTSCDPWLGVAASEQGQGQGGVIRRDLCLFRTEFKNASKEAQNFTLKTERTTTSRCEVTLMQGFRIGSNVDVKITIPPVNACRITGGLSGELQVNKSNGQTFEEQLTWSVDSQVKVEGRSRAVAALMIREEELNMDLTVDSVIRARRDHVPVYIRHIKTNQLVKRLGIPAERLPYIFTESEGFVKVDECTVKRETKGVVRLVYGAEQVVDLRTESLDDKQTLSVQS